MNYIAINIIRYCRFGNNVCQLHNAIAFAMYHGIKDVFMFSLGFPIDKRVIKLNNGIRLINGLPPAIPKKILYHKFFYPHEFPDKGECLGNINSKDILNQISSQVFEFKNIAMSNNLHVHIRSGDIFTRRKPKTNYIQPPLAYYQKAIMDRLDNYQGLVIVFENKENPVVDALIEWCSGIGIAYKIKSSALYKDIEELITAKCIIASKGSFVPIIACLSGQMDELVFFRDPDCQELLSNFDTKISIYHDSDGGYIKKWAISAQGGDEHHRQLKQLISYPMELICKK